MHPDLRACKLDSHIVFREESSRKVLQIARKETPFPSVNIEIQELRRPARSIWYTISWSSTFEPSFQFCMIPPLPRIKFLRRVGLQHIFWQRVENVKQRFQLEL